MTWLAILVGVASVAARLRPPRPRPRDGHLPPASAAPRLQQRRRHMLRRSTDEPDWARFLDRVAADIRGGSSLRRAVEQAAETLGLPPQLIEAHPHSATHPDRAVAVQALHVAGQLGGAVAATVQQAANLLREREAVRAEAAVHSAQARLSARVLTAVPLVFTAWSATTDRVFRRALCSPVGAVAAAGGLACNAIGWLWMRRLVRQAVA